jgi:hypothetical protein
MNADLSKLEGPDLHLMVARAEGRKIEIVPNLYGNRYMVENEGKDWMYELEYYTPSTNWGQGGPLLDMLVRSYGFMIGKGLNQCYVASPNGDIVGLGETTLLAGMRAFVMWRASAQLIAQNI